MVELYKQYINKVDEIKELVEMIHDKQTEIKEYNEYLDRARESVKYYNCAIMEIKSELYDINKKIKEYLANE